MISFQTFNTEITTLSDEALTTVATFTGANIDRALIDVAVATTALDQFVVQIRANGNSPYQTIYSAASDYTSPAGIMVGASGDLTALTAGSSGWVMLDVFGIESIRLRAARAAGSNAVVTIKVGAQ